MNELKIIKILIVLCLIAVISGGFLLWQQGRLDNIVKSGSEQINQFSLLKLIPELAGFKDEKTYLVLFQNNLELRPSGGYLGNFGILKVKNAKIISFNIHDTNIFDGFGEVQTDPPQPIKDYLRITNWQMRDSNWSPDFPTAAQKAEYFYHLQGGQEIFNGIIGINASVLPNLLELTGPVYLSEFNKEFKSEDALYQLEYEVEKGYVERGIDSGERKTILKTLVKEILNKLFEQDILEQEGLKDLIFKELDKKNILVFLKDIESQEIISKLNWDGVVDKSYKNDYLMIVEANLAAKKSNAFIKREVNYHVDLTQSRPEVNLEIKYIHQKEQKDWFNDDYRAYLRIYLPAGSWLLGVKGIKGETIFSDELGKTVFGNWIEIPAGQEKIIKFSYLLPARIATQSVAGGPESVKLENEYRILVQKQSGLDNLPFKIILNDNEYIKEEIIEHDWEGIISF